MKKNKLFCVFTVVGGLESVENFWKTFSDEKLFMN